MTRNELIQLIKERKSFLCVGLDTDLNKIPQEYHQFEDPIFEFNKVVIDATRDFCVAYKPNTAFYEQYGVKGWQSLEKTVNYIGKQHFIIADAKRGDIGNTANCYAKTFFETIPCDSITVAPYMGKDSVSPFLQFENKWAIVLGLTSNEGAKDFQVNELVSGGQLFENVLHTVAQWGTEENLMFVVGATRGELFEQVRKQVPNHFLLVPGVGAQGGSLQDVCNYGWSLDCGLLVNSSRGIIYASGEATHKESVKKAAHALQQEMESILQEKAFI